MPKPSSLITKRVVEYGSGSPIAGVNFSYALCVRPAFLGCDDYNSGTGVTNADSLITIPQESISSTDSFNTYIFKKNGFWSNGKAPLFSPFDDLGSDTPPISYFTDSFQVQLFPVVNITIHAKNTSTALHDKTFFHECQGQCCPGALPREGYSISLRREIDTTFVYPVFGNVENHLLIINSRGTDTVFIHSQFIVKGDNVNLEILY
ncbi:MAG: hypothetical protein ABJA71_01810 [Ginsengibacter sp.]